MMAPDRLKAFTDGVLAIIITIMVLELRVPRDAELASLRPLVPVALSYVLSFVYLVIYWNNHHHLLHVTRRVTAGILWANAHLVFWLSLVPFVTAWAGENHFAPVPMAAYGVVLLLAAIAYLVLQRVIIASQGPESVVAAAVRSDTKGKLSSLVYAIAVPSAFVHPWAAGALYVAVAMMWLTPDRRIERIVTPGDGQSRTLAWRLNRPPTPSPRAHRSPSRHRAPLVLTRREYFTLRPHGVNMPTPTTPRASERSPDTIVLVHGFWVTPRSWEHWITHYEAKGYRVLAPAYPGFEVEVEALNADPTPVERLTVPAIIAHLESIVGALDAPPILMGHSAGGAFVQILLDHGFGAAGVAINSAPTEGVLVAPWSQIRSTFPVLKSPANRHRAVGLTYEQWRYTFTNTFPEAEARALYGRYHVPASGGILWDSVLANFEPGPQATWVDYRNAARPPLLFISGGEDHLMPPVVQHSNAAHYTAETLTEVTVFEGRSHLLPAQSGWEEIADYALSWAERHAVSPNAAPNAALHAARPA